MAESDSFIQEVSEEVRRDKMYGVWRRYGPILIAVIVLAVLGTAGKGWWDSQVEGRKAELGGALIAADAIDDPAEAGAAFLAVAENEQYEFPVLARLRAGAALGQAGQLDEAEAQYEKVKNTADADIRFRDLAELRILMMRSETMPPEEQISRLAPLVEEGSAWRLPALEFEAAAHLRNGSPEKALDSLRSLAALPNVPPAAQGRASELMDAIQAQLPETVTEEATEDAPATDNTATDDTATDDTTEEDASEDETTEEKTE